MSDTIKKWHEMQEENNEKPYHQKAQSKNMFMSKMKELDEIAQGVADITMELMYDTVDWQLSDFEQDGDGCHAIHSHVMRVAIAKMYDALK